MDEESAEYKNIAEIRKAGQFAAALTHQLLAFSRGQALEVKVLDVNEIVTGLQPILRQLAGEAIHIVAVPSAEPCMVRGDHGQLEQVLLNLALNARDAMPSGGVITIQTANIVVAPDGTGGSMDEIPPGSWVRLVVRDTGAGMTASVREHLFEPFFTTKERGRGTGLGLATCYGVVKQSGGSIHCDSAPGLGTTFRIFLPRVTDVKSGSGLAAKLPIEREFEGLDAFGGKETILLVEDEGNVRQLTEYLLQKIGYTVLSAGSAEEAQEVVACHADRKFDLLLADVVLPNAGGKELAEWMKSNRPGTRILFMSGYVEEVIFNSRAMGGNVAFLQKPFTALSMAKKVRETIDGSVPA